MSTNIKTIRARFEKPNEVNSTYGTGSIHLTRFFGGVEDGQMLQIGISNGSEFTHLQLTEKQVKKLKKALKIWKLK